MAVGPFRMICEERSRLHQGLGGHGFVYPRVLMSRFDRDQMPSFLRIDFLVYKNERK